MVYTRSTSASGAIFAPPAAMLGESPLPRPEETTLRLASQKRGAQRLPGSRKRRARLLPLAGILALVVDHDPRNARLLFELLASEGCDVKIARSAEEAF